MEGEGAGLGEDPDLSATLGTIPNEKLPRSCSKLSQVQLLIKILMLPIINLLVQCFLSEHFWV